jgi:hypothetical protein
VSPFVFTKTLASNNWASALVFSKLFFAQYSVYFGETDHVIPWQTDHLNCWRTIAADAIGMMSKVMI